MPKIESEEFLFQSLRFNVVSQTIIFDDKRENRELVEMGPGVSIVVLDRNKNICLIKEWRSAFNEYIYQLPGGYCGSNDEELLIGAAKQEIREELGLPTEKMVLKKLKSFYPLGAMRNTVHIYLATVDQFAQKSHSEVFEDIELSPMPLEEAYRRFVLKNEPTTAATIIGLTTVRNFILDSQ